MEFLQAFPIAIVDEDFEGRHAAGRGIRQLASAIEREGFRVISGFGYEDARRLTRVYHNESCLLVSIDGGEATNGQWAALEDLLTATRSRNTQLPIFLLGDERTAEMVPVAVLKHAQAFFRLHEDSPEFLARTICRSASLYLERLLPPMFKALVQYTMRASYSWHTPGHGGGVAFRKSPVGRVLAMRPADAYEQLVRGDVESVEIDSLMDRVVAVMVVPYPPGIPVIMPGERITADTRSIQDYLLYAREFDKKFPGFETDIHGLRFETGPTGRRYLVDCVKRTPRATEVEQKARTAVGA